MIVKQKHGILIGAIRTPLPETCLRIPSSSPAEMALIGKKIWAWIFLAAGGGFFLLSATLTSGQAGPVGRKGELPRVVAGPMVGHVWESGAKIWVQFDRGTRFSVETRKKGETQWHLTVRPNGRAKFSWIWPDVRFTGKLTIDGLRPRTLYEYRIRTTEGLLPPRGEQTFRTAAPPGEAEDFTLGFGSCASRWGPRPDQPIFDAMAKKRLDLFLFLGDNVYYERETQEWAHPKMMWARYSGDRQEPKLQPILRRTACYAIWDDHDYGSDNSDKLYPYKDLSLHIFRSFWANPSFGSDGVPGIWTRFSRGKVDFFLLDDRYYRDSNDAPDDEHKTQWGRVQREWLADALRSSTATFKVIATGGQFLARYHDAESHHQYRHERQWLLRTIAKNGITGVLFLTGDRHLGEILRWLPPETPYPLYEMTSSPLAAGLAHQPPPDDQVPERVPGSLIMAENFGVLDFSFSDSGKASIRVRYFDVEGRPVGESLTLRAADLRANP